MATLENLTCYTGNYANYKIIATTKTGKNIDLSNEYVGFVNNTGSDSIRKDGKDLDGIIADENIESAHYILSCPDPYDRSKELTTKYKIK